MRSILRDSIFSVKEGIKDWRKSIRVWRRGRCESSQKIR